MQVRFTHLARAEYRALPAPEKDAVRQAVALLRMFGDRLGAPHAVANRRAPSLRELRPRSGRSGRRAFYRRIGDEAVIGAFGPEARSDPRGFDPAVRRWAADRLDALDEGRAWARAGSPPLARLARVPQTVPSAANVALSDLPTAEEVFAEEDAAPEARARWERSALAQAVAVAVVAYRIGRGLSQNALARQLRMRLSNAIRLEAGDLDPSPEMLERLSRALGLTFPGDVVPDATAATIALTRSGLHLISGPSECAPPPAVDRARARAEHRHND